MVIYFLSALESEPNTAFSKERESFLKQKAWGEKSDVLYADRLNV